MQHMPKYDPGAYVLSFGEMIFHILYMDTIYTGRFYDHKILLRQMSWNGLKLHLGKTGLDETNDQGKHII